MTGTRARIVAAAQQVIADGGWAAATTRRVAEVAGVRSGVIHYHFENINDLRRIAVLKGVTSYFSELREPGMPRVTPVSDLLRPMIDAISSSDATSQEAKLLYASLAAAGHDPQLRDAIRAEITELRRTIAAHTNYGRAQLLTAALDGLIMQRAFGVEIDGATLLAAIHHMLDTVPPNE